MPPDKTPAPGSASGALPERGSEALLPPLTTAWTERERLQALYRSGLLTAPPEQTFDDLVALATEMFGLPMAGIHLIGETQQFGLSQIGLGMPEMPRAIAFCPHAMVRPDGLVVPDASLDPRFFDNPLVTGVPGIRFYAGMPIKAEGVPVGAICVIGTEPRPPLTEQQRTLLRTLAAQVSAQIALRRSVAERDALLARLLTDDTLRRQTLDSAVDCAIVSTGLDGRVTGWNSGARNIFGWSEGEMLGETVERIFTPEDMAGQQPLAEMRESDASGRSSDERWHLRKDGSRFWASGDMQLLRDAQGEAVGYVRLVRDRTEQHLATRQLADSQARYRAMFEAIDAGFCIIEMKLDAEGRGEDYRFLEVNGAFERQTGLHDATGRWMRELAPAHEQHWFDIYARVVATGEAIRFENGAEALGRWYDVHAFRIGAPEERRVAILFTDILPRRQAELALQRSEAHWRGLFERLREGFILGELVRDAAGAATDWRYLEVNPACRVQTGLGDRPVQGETVRALFPGIEESWIGDVAIAVEQRRSVTFLRQVGGIGRWYEGRIHPVDEDRFAILFMEVTEQRRAEEQRMALLELGDRLRAMDGSAGMPAVAVEIIGGTLRAARAGYCVVDADGRERIEAEWHRPGVVGSCSGSIAALLDPSDPERLLAIGDLDAQGGEAAAALRACGVGAVLLLPLMEHGRMVTLLFVHDVVARTWSPDEIGFVRNVAERTRSVAERRRAEEALRTLNTSLESLVQSRTAELLRSEEQLRQSQKMEAVGQLTGGLAHDFNNLLTGIAGSLELLQTRIAQGRIAGLDRYITAAQGASQRAAALTHRLLAFSRRQTLEPKPTDVNALVEDVEELVRRTVGPSVSIAVEASPGIWTTLCDPNQLENALLNLCLNARDAMPHGGLLRIVTGNIGQGGGATGGEAADAGIGAGDYVSVAVTDTGTGMAPEVVERAFDPFFTTKPLGEGTGLGLSMVYGFVRQSGGHIRIVSAPGEGTTVRLFLPRHTGAPSQPGPLAPAEAGPRATPHQTVLVVDDEPTVRMLIGEVLQDLGYALLEAGDGQAGLHLLDTDARIDLLVTDVGLPGGMNGRQLADAARVRRPALKVLFITGYAENAVIGDTALEPGMRVLTKPFTMDALTSRVRTLIA